MAENKTKLEWRNWQWWASLAFAAFIGAALNKAPAATWHILVQVWNGILWVSSLGIQRLRDLPYRLAARNPYDTLMVISLASAAFLAPRFLGHVFALNNRSPSFWVIDLLKSLKTFAWRSHSIVEDSEKSVTPSLRSVAAVNATVNALGLVPMIVINVAAINFITAIGIRQNYFNDATIIAPTLSYDQRIGLDAILANMRTRDDWKLLTSIINEYSHRGGKKLFPPGPNPFHH